MPKILFERVRCFPDHFPPNMPISAKYSSQGVRHRVAVHHEAGYGDSAVVLGGESLVAHGRSAECNHFNLFRSHPHVQQSGRRQGDHGSTQAVADQIHLILCILFQYIG